MGWAEFWGRYATLLRRRSEQSSEERWQAALARGPGHGMRQRGVIH